MILEQFLVNNLTIKALFLRIARLWIALEFRISRNWEDLRHKTISRLKSEGQEEIQIFCSNDFSEIYLAKMNYNTYQ